ncbi:MAG: helix-turn-helix transcriptional regulator [Clostridia bacterium]|nr:helix-turn-helix transcriptional regulator [Clostridia bacterium]
MTSDELKLIGERICSRRKQLRYTQERLADEMNVSIQMVSNLERGNKAIKIDNLIKISGILGVSTDYILLGRNTESDVSNVNDKLSMLSDADLRLVEHMIDFCIDRQS